jgi:4-amino-4-deoxy-L-arabinose transferase-like glycosyltransferase
VHPFIRRILRLRVELIVIVALGAAVLSSGMSKPPLVDWDEATYAEVAHEAIANHNYFDLTWNGRPYVKKPPLLFWGLIGSFKAFGESEFAARLPSVVAGVGTLVLIYLTAAAVAGRLAGIMAALAPLEFYFFIARGGRDCATDAPLLFFITLALYAMVLARRDRRYCVLAGTASGLAMLSKGLAGTIPLIIAPAAVLILPGFESLGLFGVAVIFGLAIVVASPWYIHEATSNPLFWTSFVHHETLARVARHLEDETHSGWFTLREYYREIRFLWPLILPALAFGTAAIRGRTIRRAFLDALRGLRRIDPAIGLWAVWLAVTLGAACAVQTKLPWYILPALVPTALLAGTLAARALEHRGPMRFAVTGAGALAVAIITAGVPAHWWGISWTYHRERLRSTPSYLLGSKAQRAAAMFDGGRLYFAGSELPTLVYYSRMNCEFIKPQSGLEDIRDSGSGPTPQLDQNDLALLDPQGDLIPIANFASEWEAAGLGSH